MVNWKMRGLRQCKEKELKMAGFPGKLIDFPSVKKKKKLSESLRVFHLILVVRDQSFFCLQYRLAPLIEQRMNLISQKIISTTCRKTRD